MNDIVPQKLGDKYILLDLIGTGGMAEVYRAKQIGEQGFEKLIVIKKLLEQAARDPGLVEHFTAEARLAALLQHENIAAVYDFGCISNRYFIAMEYLFGKDLFAILQALQARNQLLPPQYALMIAIKICEAMGYAHGLTDFNRNPLNIVHRDLTPHNIFISYEGRVKVIDFGIAKTEMHENMTRVGVVKGKITYMAPEQLASEKIDHRADIFSIGILLYEMLSGKRMYTGDTASLIRKAVKVEYIPLEKVVPGFDADIYMILHKTLALRPEERYVDCEEMRVDLEKCLGNLSLYYDPRLLSQFVTNLFESEYRLEERVCRNALQAAALMERPGADSEEKTEIFIPDFSPGSDAEAEERSGGEEKAVVPNKQKQFHLLSALVPSFVKPFHAIVVSMLVAVISVGILLLASGRKDPVDSGINVVEHTATDNSNAEKDTPAAVKESEPSRQGYPSGRRRVDELVRKAEQAVGDGRVETPPGNNALYYYKELEKYSPGDPRIDDGMKRISDYYAQQAESALGRKEYGVSAQMINKGLDVTPSSGRLLGIRERLGNETQGIIADLKEKMELSLEENRLTSPVDDCALKYIDAISRLDKDNVLVAEGYRRIGNRYAVLAESSFRRAEYDRARYFVREGLKVVPDNRRLQVIRRDLARGKPGLIFKTLEKNVKTLIDM